MKNGSKNNEWGPDQPSNICYVFLSSLSSTVSSSQVNRQVCSSNQQMQRMNWCNFIAIGLAVRNLSCLSCLVELLCSLSGHSSFHGNLKGLYFLRISGIYWYSAEMKVSSEQDLQYSTY